MDEKKRRGNKRVREREKAEKVKYKGRYCSKSKRARE
jgi:hypothetical protein